MYWTEAIFYTTIKGNQSYPCLRTKPGKGITGNGANLNADFTLGV